MDVAGSLLILLFIPVLLLSTLLMDYISGVSSAQFIISKLFVPLCMSFIYIY